MFEIISKIASNLGIPIILLYDELFYEMFSSWYFYSFHHWEYIIPEDDYSLFDYEENSSSSSEDDYFSEEYYISDTGSDYDMHEFESYYYEYVS